jgi:hypothetical protein
MILFAEQTMRSAIFLSAIVVIAINAHAAEELASMANPATGIEPVFDCYRTNSAWGFTLSGKVIDGKGNVWSYGKRGQAWLPTRIKEGDASYLTAGDLQAKFVEAKQIGNVEAKALADNAALIAKAAEGKLTQADTGTRDAGTSDCHAYLHDAAKRRYRDIELGSDGGVSDVRHTNDAAEAKVILTWLKSVGVAN